MSNAIFITGSSGGDRFFYKISEELKKIEGINPYFIATTRANQDYLKSQNLKKNQIILIDYPHSTFYEPNQKFIADKELEYDFRLWDLWEITATRHTKRDKIEETKILFWFEYIIKKFEKILNETNAEYFFVCGPAGFHVLLMYAIAKKRGLKIIDLITSPLPNRFIMVDSISCKWDLIEKKYNYIKKNGLEKEKREKIKRFIENYRNLPIKNDSLVKHKEHLLKKINRHIIYIKHIIKNRYFPQFYQGFLLWPLWQKYYDYGNFYDKPNLKQNYVLFPLHFIPEITTSIYGKWYQDQIYIIENISRSLPLGHLLYVKENPYGYGNRKINFYKRIKRLPNVKLIGPKENNFELIRNSKLVLTITGTSGWEALIFNKPVITFGNVFYNISPEVKNIKNMDHLPIIIKELLSKKISEDEIIKLMAALYEGSFPGLVRLPAICGEISLKEENVKKITKGIIKYINI